MRLTLELADEQAEATIRLELEAARESAGALERRVNAARREILASYVAAFGSTEEPARFGPELEGLLRGAEGSIRQAFDGQAGLASRLTDRYVREANQLGVDHAAAVLEDVNTKEVPDPEGPEAAGAGEAVTRGRDDALRLLSGPLVVAGGVAGLLAVVGRANRAVAEVKAATRTGVNRAHNLAVSEVASPARVGRVWIAERDVSLTDPTGVNRAHNRAVSEVASEARVGVVWIAERDGCVECLAYAGEVAYAGEEFPGGLTMDTKKPRNTRPLPSPPLHPNCRCSVIPYRETDGAAFPDALKREARRSVAKGWRVESESEAVRLRAAESLLRRGADLPQSVQDQAERSLSRASFPDRRVPKYEAP